MQFDRGYLSPYFINNEASQSAQFENPTSFSTTRRCRTFASPLLEGMAKSRPSALVVAEDVEGEALATLVVNTIRGIVKVAPVKAPGFGDRRKAMLQESLS